MSKAKPRKPKARKRRKGKIIGSPAAGIGTRHTLHGPPRKVKRAK